jgi:hypothetical protein
MNRRKRIAQLPLYLCALVHTACSGDIVLDGGRPLMPGMSPEPGSPDPEDSPTTTDGDESTGGLSTSGAETFVGDDSSAAASGDAGVCGDGVVGDGEACDEGAANSDAGACTDACALNVCGDGLVHAGVEKCDEGQANSDLYGHACTTACGFGQTCGDGIVQAGAGEECEPVDGDDGDDGAGQKCDAECRLLAYRGFITSTVYTGDLGGLDGADAACVERATAGGLPDPGSFRAFLSSADVSANDRFVDKIGDTRPYLLPGGLQFAASYTDLVTNGPGDVGISITEFGTSLVGAQVATNTTPDGNVAAAETSCASWLSASKDFAARVGLNVPELDDPNQAVWKAEGWWADAQTWSCDKMYFHLYCLE